MSFFFLLNPKTEVAQDLDGQVICFNAVCRDYDFTPDERMFCWSATLRYNKIINFEAMKRTFIFKANEENC